MSKMFFTNEVLYMFVVCGEPLCKSIEDLVDTKLVKYESYDEMTKATAHAIGEAQDYVVGGEIEVFEKNGEPYVVIHGIEYHLTKEKMSVYGAATPAEYVKKLL